MSIISTATGEPWRSERFISLSIFSMTYQRLYSPVSESRAETSDRMRLRIKRSMFSCCIVRKRCSRSRYFASDSAAPRTTSSTAATICRSLPLSGAPARTPSPGAATTVIASSATASSTSESGLSITVDRGRRMRSASSAIRVVIRHSLGLERGLYAMLDAEAVHARADLVAAVHLRIFRRQRIQECAVPAAEVADADRAVGVGEDFEVAAREELVGHAHVALAADHEAGDRNLELLPAQRALDADEHGAAVVALRLFLQAAKDVARVRDRGVEQDRLDHRAALLGRLDAEQRRAGAHEVHAVADDGLGDLLPVEKRFHVRAGVAEAALVAAQRGRAGDSGTGAGAGEESSTRYGPRSISLISLGLSKRARSAALLPESHSPHFTHVAIEFGSRTATTPGRSYA